MLTYDLTKGDGSLYTKLYQYIKHDISSGILLPDEKLPSRRALAKNLGISTVTVDNAYEQLIEEGYIYALPKKGYYVAHITNFFPVADLHPPKLKQRKSVKRNDKTPKISFDFSSNKPDTSSFPFSVWARLIRTTILDHSDDLLKVSSYNGIYELREAISDHLFSFRGMVVDPDQIVIGAGTEYLYGLLIKLLGKDKKYCIENPGFKKIRQIYEVEGISYDFAEMDDMGMQVSELIRCDADIAHISPTHHFPTGITMPVSRRYEILSWAAQKKGRYIIEDDYDSEFRQKGSPIPPLQNIDTLDRVIYINTFSKSLTSTIRIAYMVLPVILAKKLRDELSFYSCTVSTFDQYTLAAFIKKGFFEKHINRMRLQYGRKRDQVLSIIQSSLSKYRIDENDSGLHFILELRTGLSDAELEKELLKKGIKISAISDFYMQNKKSSSRTKKPNNGLFIIDYSNMDVSMLPGALDELKKIISGI